MGEKRENWMTYFQEYDLEFNLVHTFKGHGLYQFGAKAGYVTEQDISIWE